MHFIKKENPHNTPILPLTVAFFVICFSLTKSEFQMPCSVREKERAK